MPKTRKISARKDSGNSDDENCKENAQKRRPERVSKAEALKKITENVHEESPDFAFKKEKPPDTFDLLRSSPMKQEVNFKPLSFWSKKVKDLESQEHVKKKKCQLYELSETDDSITSQESKKVKKKGGRKTAGQVKSRKKNVDKQTYYINVKNLVKKEQRNSQSKNNEGAIVREQIILRRLNAKYLDKKNKFSFNTVASFGLTSTPGKSEKLNLIGGSTFNFLSPIPSSQSSAVVENQNENDDSIVVKNDLIQSEPEGENLGNEILITPKRLRKTGGKENVLTKDLKRADSIEHDSCYTETVESDDQDSILLYAEDDVFNKSFLKCSECETESEESDSQDLDDCDRVGGGDDTGYIPDTENSISTCHFSETVAHIVNLSKRFSAPSSFYGSAIDSNNMDGQSPFRKFPTKLRYLPLADNSDTTTNDESYVTCTVEKSDSVLNYSEPIFSIWSTGDDHVVDGIPSHRPGTVEMPTDAFELFLNLSQLSLFFTDPSTFNRSAIELGESRLREFFGRTTVSLHSQSISDIPQTLGKEETYHLKRSPRKIDSEHTNVDYSRDFASCDGEMTMNSRRDSSANVVVRRRFNAFLNYRLSEKDGNVDLPRDGNAEELLKPDCDDTNNNKDETYFDCLRCDVSDEHSFGIDITLKNDSSIVKTNDLTSTMLDIENKNCQMVEMSAMRDSELEDQQYHGRNELENEISVLNNSKMGSDQYRSQQSPKFSVQANKEICFNAGNDSSVFKTSPGTPSDADCSVCKRYGGVKRRASSTGHKDSDGGISPAVHRHHDRKEPTKFEKVEKVDITSGIASMALRQYKKPAKLGVVRESSVGFSVVDSPPVKKLIAENTISADLTFNDEFEFPLPIFESTTYRTSIAKGPAGVRGSLVGNNFDGSGKFGAGVTGVSAVQPEVGNDSECESKIGEVTSSRLKPGKKWARSAQVLKKAMNGTLISDKTSFCGRRGRNYQTFVEEVINMQADNPEQTVLKTCDQNTMIPISNRLSMYRQNVGNRTVKVIEDSALDGSFRSIFLKSASEKRRSALTDVVEDVKEGTVVEAESSIVSARDLVLARCGQEAPLPFEEVFNKKTLGGKCKKIGEGIVGEVFMCNGNRVIKIMPIEGPDEVNGGPQKKFDEILAEMVIAMELSNLQKTEKFYTTGFCELKKCWCLVGKYPEYLLQLWNDFDSSKGSENDSPAMFKSDQLYIALEFGNGGMSLEAFVFSSADQCVSVLLQIAYSLVVAEKVLEFEHRDLHWGNILIAPTKAKYFKVLIDGSEHKIPTKGVKVTIIDFTLSRITYDGCSIYYDLADDPSLFISQGDYQFEIYRMMKAEVMNDWSLYKQKTNLFWLHYIVDKMLKMVRCKKTHTKTHTSAMSTLSNLESSILKYANVEEFLLNENLE